MFIVCPSCFTANRIPDDKNHLEGKCGRCKAQLHTFSPANLNDTNFFPFIEKNDLPVLVDFWAGWCGPCKMMAPVFEKTASQSETLLFAKVETEKAPNVSQQMNIRSIPTLIIFHGGRELDRVSGALSEPQLKQWILQTLAKA